jgi:hypothetical protein
MARTGVTGDQVQDSTLTGDDILDGSIGREDLNITSTGRAVVRKILAGAGVSLVSSGIDAGTGDVEITIATSAGLVPITHRALDQLVHELAETSYCEIGRTNGRVSSAIYYETASKLKKIREILYTRTSGRVTQVVIKQYDSSGVLIVGETLTGTITRTLGRVSSVDWVLS